MSTQPSPANLSISIETEKVRPEPTVTPTPFNPMEVMLWSSVILLLIPPL